MDWLELILFFWLFSYEASSAAPENCDRVKYTFEQNGYSAEVPRRIQGLQEESVCGSEHCCTTEMQRQLVSYSRRDFANKQTSLLDQLHLKLKQRADTFDDVFKAMLNSSKQEFHQMFMKTYGVIYEQNAYVFTDLFKELERYYGKGNVDLTATLDDFFNILYQKMFTVLNAGYTFTDKYLECVNERMKELKPFGDVPSKLSTLLKRSFYATRTFSQSLHVAADIVRNMENLTMSETCNVAIAKVFHCSECSGYGELPPCPDYCTSVIRQCHTHHIQLESHWNSFIDATDKVIERLLGPFNIEMVVIPIDIKISEAIMNFQENAQQVTQRVFSGCGKPILGRNRRDMREKGPRRVTGEIPFETLDFSNRGGGGEGGGRGGKEESGKLERVIRETREVLRSTRGYWQGIPNLICKESLQATSCWDGKTKVFSRLPGSTKSPEVRLPELGRSSLVNEQTFALQQISNRLRSAYNGVDVDWIDSEDLESGSGSGSGPDIEDSGSGDSPTELPDVVSQPPSPSPPSFSPPPSPPQETLDEEHLKKNLPPPPPPARPEVKAEEEANEIPQIPDMSRWPGNGTVSTGERGDGRGAAPATRAAFVWIVPIILVSFGNSVLGMVS